MYIDSYALIVQQDLDGGDTLHREGMYAFGKWLRYDHSNNTVFVVELPGREDPQKIMSRFEVRPGIYVRHPDPNKWYSNPATTSRDQLVPVIAFCAAYSDHARLWRLFKRVAGRGFFAQNFIENGDGKWRAKVPDTMLTHLGLFIRAGGYWTWPLYPVLWATDTIHLAGTIVNLLPVTWSESQKRFRSKSEGDVDDNNVIIYHLLAAKFKPTLISFLDRQLYAFTRARNKGNTVFGETNSVMGALAWYHRTEARGNPELAELYRPLIHEFFSPQDQYEELTFKFRQAWISLSSGRIITAL